MSLVQRQFKYKEYMQFPRTGDDCEHTDVNDPFFLSRGWARSQICMMIKGYYGIGIDTMKYCLTTSVSDAQDLIFYTMDTFSRRMFRQPSIPEFIRFFEWLDAYGSQSTKDKVEDYITNSNEHKYIDSCLTTFLSWSAGWPSKADGALNVRYYGPIGTSGYAVACKNMVRALSALPTVRLQFVPMSIQNMDLSDNGPDNTAFASACPFSVKKLYAGAAWEWGSLPAPDIVIIHSVPTMWIPIAIREKQFSATVLLIGVTVWETDAIPRPWIPYLQWVDYVTFPNEWNAAVFRQAVPGLKTDFIPHPVTPLPVVAVGDAVAPELVSLISDKQANSNLYVFYTINEFSGRKGIDTLLRSYINSFKATDQVVLFVKTGGDVPQQTAQQYILKLAANNPYPPRIVLDYTRWSDSDIAVLHEVGDCFVSLTRAEGQGMGACAAGLAGKAVIMTDYGGQKDYLKGIHYVPYELVPATYCLPFDPQHANCLALPSCRRFPNFHPCDQRWGLADERAAEGALWQAYAEKWTGVSQTVDYITQQFSPAVVAARFESFMRSKFAASGDRVFFPSSLPDSFDQPEEYFQPQSQVLPLNMVTEFRYPVRGTRPVVVVIGCSGFGDFGDDLYAAMHKVYLGQDYDVYVCNTRSFVYKDGNLRFATDYASSEDLLSFDYLLIGGGSIVNSAELKSTIFTIYFPFCQANNIPVSVVSVGCGYDTSVASPVLSQDVLDAWTPLLNYANFITVQSVRDYETLAPLVTIKRRFRLQARPDLAYGADEAFPATRPPKQKDCVIFCPGGVVTMQHEDIALRLQTLTWESKYLQSSLVFMPLDGMRDTTYPTAETQAELDRVKAQFPKAVIFQGRFYNGPFLKLMGLQDPSNASVMTVGAVVDIFRNAKAVVTGNYHGLVLGRLFGLEVDDSRSGLQRLTDEQLTPLSKDRWRDSYCFVKNDIDLQCLATADARGMCDKEPDDWTDADRNTAIVDLCTQYQNILSAPSLEYAQSYTNLQLWMCDHPLYTRALHALADHDYVGAIQLLSTTLSEVSTKHATHVRGKLGSAYLQQAHWVTTCFPLDWSSHDIIHNLHQARQHMECAITQVQFGDVAFLHTELADLHMVQLNYAEAIEHARQGLACASNKWIWLKAQCLMHYASFLQKGHEGTTDRLDALALQTRPWGSPYTSLVGFYLALAHYHRGELDDAEFIFAQDDMRGLPDVMRVRCYQMLQRIYVDQGVPWRCMAPLRYEVDALLRRSQPVDILFGRLEQCVADMFANYAMTAETVSGMLPHLRYIREALNTKARLHPVSTLTLFYFEEVFCVRSGDLLSALMAVQEQRLLLRSMGNTDETRLLCLLGVISNAPVAEVSRLVGTIRMMCTVCPPPGFVVEMISELERRGDSCDTSTASFETAHEHHHDTDDEYSSADSLNVCVDMDGSSSVDSEEQPAECVPETPERDVDSKAAEPTRPQASLGLSCHMVFDREKLRPTRIERVSPPRAPTDIDVETFVLRVLKVRQVAQITDEKLSEIMRQIRERGYPPLYVRLAKVVLVERTSPKEAATGYVKLLEAEDMRRIVMSRLLQLLKKECRVLIQDHACWPVLHEAVVTLTAIMATKPCCEELVGLLFDVAVHIVTDCGRLSDDGHPAVYHPITSVNMLMLAFRDKPASTPLLTFKHKHLLNVFNMFICRHVAPRLDKQTSWLVLKSPSSKDLSVMRGRMVRVAQELMVHAKFKAAHSLVHIVLAKFPGNSEVMARDLAEFLLLQYDRSTRCAPEFMGSTMPTLPLAHLYVEFPDTTEQVFKAQQQIIRRSSTGDLVGLHHLIKGDLRLAWDAWGDDHPSSTMLRAFLLYAAHKRGVDEVVQEHMSVLKVRANDETELSRMVVGSVLSKIDTAETASLAESVGGDIAWPLMSVKLLTECRHTLRIGELEA